jgi:hypothetical protein
MFRHRCWLSLAIVGSAAALGLVSAAAADSTGTFAVGGGFAVGSGVTKHFAFSAHQTSSTTLAASGYAVEQQIDPTGAFGDFRLQGPVQCVRVVGNHAIIGLTIEKGSGTAVGHVGEAFYLVADDGGGVTPDTFDNSGYTGTTTVDCNFDGTTNGVVTQGNILVRQ